MDNDKSKRMMNREEEILNASADTFISCGDEFTRAIKMLWVTAFIAGAAWADKHPDISALWHPASEEPQGNNWKILCQDEENGCWVENRTDAIDLHNTWNEYVEIEMVVKWAYISDLLPK